MHLIWDPRRGQPGEIYSAIGGLCYASKKKTTFNVTMLLVTLPYGLETITS